VTSVALRVVAGRPEMPAGPGPASVALAACPLAVMRLDLGDFRNYARLRLETPARPVVLVGPNGAGKTNLLEAISFLAPGRGLRRAALAEPQRAGAPDGAGWAVAARLDTPGGEVAVGTGLPAGGSDGRRGGARRAVRVDGADARGQAALAERLNIVWLTPDMDRLFQEAPSVRRRFLDRLVFGYDPGHATRINAYEKALAERARLLRDGADRAWLAAVEETLAREGVAVAAARRETVARLDAALAAADAGSADDFPRAAMALDGEVEGWLAEGPALAAEERLAAAFAASRAIDAAAGRALRGPHRSDLAVRHRDADTPAARGSTGEQKALLAAIVLAHARLVAAQTGAPPLLLLDEVTAHLDPRRRAALFARVLALGAQAWFTGTDAAAFAPLAGHAHFLRVEAATLRPFDPSLTVETT